MGETEKAMTEAQELIKLLKRNGMSHRSIGAAIGKKTGTVSRIAKGVTKGDRHLEKLSKLADLSPNIVRTLTPYIPTPLSHEEIRFRSLVSTWRAMGESYDNLPDGLHIYRPRHDYESGPYIAMSRQSQLRHYFPAEHESEEIYQNYLDNLEALNEQEAKEKELRKKAISKQRSIARRETMRKKKTEEALVAGVVAVAVGCVIAILRQVLL
jgi:transcriptional regulator with XRE-family HTH domain